MSAGCPTCLELHQRARAEAAAIADARTPGELVGVGRALVWGLLTFALVAAGGTVALGRERHVAKQPVVVVVDCQAEPDVCSAVVSATAVSAGDADQR